MASDPQPFDWHPYITIDPSFTPAQRTQIEQGLNDISRFADREGQALIIEGFRNNGNQPISIVPSAAHGGTRWIPDGDNHARIQVDFDENTYLLGPGGVHREISLTASLTHELYHMADRSEDIDRQADRTLLDILHVASDDPRRLTILKHVQDIAYTEGISRSEVVAEMMVRPANMIAALRGANMNDLADNLATMPATARIEKLIHDGIISRDIPSERVVATGIYNPRFESDAVDFTRAVIEKNYGPTIPVAVRYNQTRREDAPPAPALPLPSGTVFPTTGFTAASYHVDVHDLGELASPPHVAPVPSPTQERTPPR